jgi:cystathionine beta-lyase family protein involved in aluminum resistance
VNELFRKAVEPFGFPGALLDCACASLERVAGAWAKRDETALAVGAKVLKCFAEAGLHQGHLAGTTGYGYHDSGREAYEALLARTLGAQASMARLHFVSGTHAIVAATHALLGPEGRLCSVTGAPYDTLRVALTAPLENDKRNGRGRYLEVPLSPDGTHDPYGVAAALKSSPEVIFLQRSRGYARRQATSIEEIASIVALIREQSPSSAILVDNCYGEFVELREPCEVGDIIIVVK